MARDFPYLDQDIFENEMRCTRQRMLIDRHAEADRDVELSTLVLASLCETGKIRWIWRKQLSEVYDQSS